MNKDSAINCLNYLSANCGWRVVLLWGRVLLYFSITTNIAPLFPGLPFNKMLFVHVWTPRGLYCLTLKKINCVYTMYV